MEKTLHPFLDHAAKLCSNFFDCREMYSIACDDCYGMYYLYNVKIKKVDNVIDNVDNVIDNVNIKKIA